MKHPTLLLLLAAAAAAPVHAQVAKVNGVAIPQSRFDMALKARAAQGQPDTPEVRNSIKDALINQEVVAQEALKKGLDKTPAVAAQLELRRQDVLVNAYVEDYLRANPISDEALRKEYERIKAQMGGREFKARHILVDKEDEAKEVIAQLKKGASFEKIATDRSKDPGSKARGGELDWAVPSNYVKPFGDALLKLKKGQLTDAPVQSSFGWHVIRLDDERPLKVPPFEEVKANLQRNMQQQQVQKLVSDLRAKAKVE
jgi:peptidyl-prolyl cis-trans isomerase C